MNNVGAMALLMPASVRMAIKGGNPPSILLMPLAFGSLLGGLLTLIGTPPNIIVSAYREEHLGAPLKIFDFAPVGAGVLVAGLLFIWLIGWKLTPRRKAPSSREDLFEIENYLTEVLVPEGSKLAGKSLQEVREASKAEFQVLGLLRGETRFASPSVFHPLLPGDILLVESDAEVLKTFLAATGFELAVGKKLGEDLLRSEEMGVSEAVVKTDSLLIGRTARSLNMRWRYGVNLVAVARHGARLQERLGRIRFQAGDVLLLQGPKEFLPEVLSTIGCLPLAERGLRLGQPKRFVLSVGIFGSAIFGGGSRPSPRPGAFVLLLSPWCMSGLLTFREAYDSISTGQGIVLLGGLIRWAAPCESTGGAELISSAMLAVLSSYSSVVILTALLIWTMILTNIVNNAAAAVIMSPIALNSANFLGSSPDPFLMAVAIGSSCAFLTPIGHQTNTLVMGPGGYHFGDYWRLGLPLSCVAALAAIPLILWFWPI
jgi:di/tricarboxylate transporter